MTEMLKFHPTPFIEIDYNELDAIVQEFYGVTNFSTMSSITDDNAGMYLTYTFDDYDKIEFDVDECKEFVQKWQDSAAGTGVSEIRSPDWVTIISLLIMEGRLPMANYLLELFY